MENISVSETLPKYIIKGRKSNLSGDNNTKLKKSRQFRIGTTVLLRSIYSAPVSKCILDTSYNLIFLLLQSYMLLVTLKTSSGVSDLEWALFVLMLCGTFKSLVLLTFYETLPWQDRLRFYLYSNKWFFISLGNTIVFIFGEWPRFYFREMFEIYFEKM